MGFHFEKLLKLGIAVLVLSGFCFEFFFLFGLGLELRSTPIATQDLLRSWVILGPLAALYVASLSIWASVDRAEDYKTEIEIVSSAKNPIKSLFWRALPFRILILISYIYLFAFLTIGYLILPATIALVHLIQNFLRWLSHGASEKIRDFYSFTIEIVPALVLVSAYAYYMGNFYHVKISNSSSYIKVDELKRPIVRTYDQWTLIDYSNEEFVWVSNTSQQLIFTPKQHTVFKGFMCPHYETCINRLYPTTK